MHKRFKVISTRRAGTNLFKFLLERNFDIELAELNHPQPDLYCINLMQKHYIPILME